MCRIAFASLVTVVVVTATGSAQDGSPREHREKPKGAAPVGGIEDIARELKKFGPWEKRIKFIDTAMDNVWEANGWNDESDRFALSTAKEVARIPPWKVTDRLDRFTGLIAQRYSLSPRQTTRLKGSILRETAGIVMRHAPLMMKQIHKVLETDNRLSGGEITQQSVADFVADWTRATEPIHQDALESLKRTKAEFESTLTPLQKKIYERDAKMLDKMLTFIDERRTSWALGNWKPQDWGLSSDMLKDAADAAKTRRAAERAAKADAHGPQDARQKIPTRWVPHDPATWIAYARHVIKQFKLDEAQAAAVRSIHDELEERADKYLDTHRDELAGVNATEKSSGPGYKPVRDWFDLLVIRLDAIPTQAQKDAADQ